MTSWNQLQETFSNQESEKSNQRNKYSFLESSLQREPECTEKTDSKFHDQYT